MSSDGLHAATRSGRSLFPTVVAGRLVVVALPTVMLVLTYRQRDFLVDVGWSPVQRTPTEWPSILALGPWGPLMSVGFLGAAVGALVIARQVSQADSRRERVAAVCVAVAALGLTAVALPADLPNATQSWHGFIHNLFYPCIPLGVIVAAALLSRRVRHTRDDVTLTVYRGAYLALLMLFLFAATAVGPIAQLARYFAFASLLTWLWLLAGSADRKEVDP